MRSVRVELRPEDVDKAAAAWLDGFEVAVHGDVEPYGTGMRMRGGAGVRGQAGVNGLARVS